MVDLTDILLPHAVTARLDAPTREVAITALATLLGAAARIDPHQAYESVMQRERLAGTGIGEGVAIPHALIDGLTAPVGAFARLDTAVNFGAIDGRPADLVFLMLAPKGQGDAHLKALARITRFFRRADTRQRLRAARSYEEVYAVFSRDMASDAA